MQSSPTPAVIVSRRLPRGFVGNISGAPLVMEGLLAFFLESTFIGLWVFGRNRPPLVHTLSICMVRTPSSR